MPVLDIAASQQLSQPVTEYLRGKAIRLANESARLQNEERQSALDYEPERRAMVREELDLRTGAAQTEAERYRTAQARLDKTDADNAAKTEREIQDNAATEQKNFQESPEMRAGALSLLEGHLKAPTKESTQSYLDYVKQHAPNFYSLNKDKFDKDKDGILDVDVVKNAVGLIKAANLEKEGTDAASIQELDRATRIFANPNSTKEEISWAKNKTNMEAEKDLFTGDQKEINQLVDNGTITREEGDNILLDNLRARGATSSGAAVRERKIASLVSQGLSEEDASAMADGFMEMKYSEATGQVILTDLRTGEAREVPVNVDDSPLRAKPEAGHTLYDMAELATGPESFFKNAVAVPLSWLEIPHDDRRIYARQAFKTTSREFIRVMSLNKKYPLGEQTRILEEIASKSEFWSSGAILRTKLRSVSDSLRYELSNIEADAIDMSLVAKERAAARSTAVTIKNFLNLLGAPTGMEESGGKHPGISAEDAAFMEEYEKKHGGQ